ncbi:MAG: adenylate/guanylate cyclase domain-containing protein [Acidimicrobiales bacterium]
MAVPDVMMTRVRTRRTVWGVQELRRRVNRQLNWGITGANWIGAVAVFLFLELALDPDPIDLPLWVEASSCAAFVAVASVVGYLVGKRIGKPCERWLSEERVPTPVERRATLLEPSRCAALTLGLWAVAAVLISTVIVALYDGTGATALRIADSIVFGGLMTTALVYLMVEKILRPVFALALQGAPPERPASLGIRPRLLLAWALGSGVPLFGVAVAPSAIESDNWQLPLAVLSGLGLLAGSVLTFLVARAVASPLEQLRDGLARVERGDLDVGLTVDDGGEVGQLQAGFNRMVEGLRERQRLRELFGRQVGEQVAQMAIEQGASLDGEQFEASVLFVDLVGSSGLAEDRPPGEALAVFNRLFSTAVRVVNEEGGYVSRFEGDGALCVFGAPAPLADHASCALRAGRRLAAELSRAGLAIGVGISSGIVVAGNVGTPERYEYTVIGGPVHEAARLTKEAKHHPERVLASEAAVARADVEALQWADGGELALRGRVAPTRVYAPAAVSVGTLPSGS